MYFTTSHSKSLESIVTQMMLHPTNLKMNFMYEHHGGIHIVTNKKKCCDVTFGIDATRVFQTMLVWGLKLFTILSKVGCTFDAQYGIDDSKSSKGAHLGTWHIEFA